MAESYMSSTISAKIASRMVKNFWKQRLDMLLEIRKILEQIPRSKQNKPSIAQISDPIIYNGCWTIQR